MILTCRLVYLLPYSKLVVAAASVVASLSLFAITVCVVAKLNILQSGLDLH